MRTPLYDEHAALGARMIDFNGWDMPLMYSGIIDEHGAVREKAGIFDLCHMARIKVTTGEAASRLSSITTNDIYSIKYGRAAYSLITSDSGGIIDDILIYRFRDHFLVVANAGNRGAVLEELAGSGVSDLTVEAGMIAVQGPASSGIVSGVFEGDVKTLRNYGFGEFDMKEAVCPVSRTGYTGEDGFEIFCPAGLTAGIWKRLMASGGPAGLKPAGLGSRDLLRLEAGMPLYGNELSLSVDPFEAGLGRFVSFEKKFRGRDALEKYRTSAPERVLAGFAAKEKGIPRPGCGLYSGDKKVGEISSGSYSPSLDKSIGMGYINRMFAAEGTDLELRVRNRTIGVRVVSLPFYRKGAVNVSV